MWNDLLSNDLFVSVMSFFAGFGARELIYELRHRPRRGAKRNRGYTA